MIKKQLVLQQQSVQSNIANFMNLCYTSNTDGKYFTRDCPWNCSAREHHYTSQLIDVTLTHSHVHEVEKA